MDVGLSSGHDFHTNTVIMGHLATVDERWSGNGLPPHSPLAFDVKTAGLICFSEVQLIRSWPPLSVDNTTLSINQHLLSSLLWYCMPGKSEASV